MTDMFDNFRQQVPDPEDLAPDCSACELKEKIQEIVTDALNIVAVLRTKDYDEKNNLIDALNEIDFFCSQ